MDEHENYYETGSMVGDYGAGGDTLILSTGHYYVDTANGSRNNSFVYSLDRNGNFRFILRDTVRGASAASLGSCKYDMRAHRLIISLGLDTLNAYGRDTLRIAYNNYNYGVSFGALSIDTSGKALWGKFITGGNAGYYPFDNVITPKYISHKLVAGFIVYNNSDTIRAGTGFCPFNCSDYYRDILQIDTGGNYQASYKAHLGAINTNVYGDYVQSGATDWRGNLYMGGSITSYMSLPNGDSVSNTDPVSGNFFIAKIGISDCSCPTPGAQFSQISNGDTVYFYGSSINHSDSIHWEFGDGTIASGDTFRHLYSQSGTYNVTAIAYSGCGVDSITKQVTVRNVGIAVIEPDKTNLYPNPVSNAANLEVSGAARIGLVAANGTSMWDQPIQVSQSGTYVFDMGKYSGGLYYFIVEYTNGKVDVMPIVKE